LVWTVGLWAISATAVAQTHRGFGLDQFQPAPAGDRFFAVQGADAGGHVNPRLMLLGEYAYRPLVLYQNPGEHELGAVVSDQLFLHVAAGIGLWDRLGVSVDFPVALLARGENPTTPSTGTFRSPSGAGVGDLRLGARVRIVGRARSAFTLGVAGYLWLPTGQQSKFAGDGAVHGLPALVLAGESGRFAYAVNAGVALRSSRTFANTTLDHQLVFAGAAGLLLAERKLQVGPELYGSSVMAGSDAFQRGTTNLEGILGARYRVGAFVLGAGAGPGFTHGLGTPALRAVASVAFAPEPSSPEKAGPRDADHDGIIDPKDACVLDVGKPSDDPRTNGCPDMDKDGIRDPLDACVDVPGPENENPKLNGCPPDRDGDGVPDDDDACPDVKGPKNEDPKLNGCPHDRDGDGILDDDDACPDLKGSKSEDPTRNGCPGDTDGDGITDDKDACPKEKGEPDPDPNKNGCPSLVRVTEKEIVILQQVQFKTASDVILPESNELLTQVANVLREHSEILKIEVQGHTDNRGGAAYNQKLSQRRAASVVKWLTAAGGIVDDRLSSKGYGMDDPIADNDAAEGRQKNRRVQFKILESKQKSE
jgi:outer membrane protein OmpA-like peptidoglycan-associated protein